jgi:hypothetical protein
METLTAHSELNVKCDLCEEAAVGYKEIRVTAGLVFTTWHYYWRGFLCNRHTREWIGRANKLNLMCCFLFAAGWLFLYPLFKTMAQATSNISLFPEHVGLPGIDNSFDIGLGLLENAKAPARFWSLKMPIAQSSWYLESGLEFIVRGLSNDKDAKSHDESTSRLKYVKRCKEAVESNILKGGSEVPTQVVSWASSVVNIIDALLEGENQ